MPSYACKPLAHYALTDLGFSFGTCIVEPVNVCLFFSQAWGRRARSTPTPVEGWPCPVTQTWRIRGTRTHPHTHRGGILPRLRGFPWNRNRNPWLMTIISAEKKLTEKTTTKNEAIRVCIWLVRILSFYQVIPGCVHALHCCSGFQNGQTSSLAEKVSMKLE